MSAGTQVGILFLLTSKKYENHKNNNVKNKSCGDSSLERV